MRYFWYGIVSCAFSSLFIAKSASAVEQQKYLDLLGQSYEQWKQEWSLVTDKLREKFPDMVEQRIPIGESQGIDYVYLPPKGREKNLIIMTSGMHGVEAAAGVMIQHYLLQECPSAISRDTGFLVFHVMNPHGTQVGRRVNASNIDLNRNFFVDNYQNRQRFPGLDIANPFFETNRRLFTRRTYPARLLLQGAQALLSTYTEGGPKAFQEVATVQYTAPQSIHFGGHGFEPEVVQTQQIMARYIKRFEDVLVADFHTGLGQSGVNMVMVNAPEDNAPVEIQRAFKDELRWLGKLFPRRECQQRRLGRQNQKICKIKVYKNYLKGGLLAHWIHSRFPQKRLRNRLLSFTAEIGTEPSHIALSALINENYCMWQEDSCPRSRLDKDRSKLKKVFNPPNPVWKKRVFNIAGQMCKALTRFSTLP